LQSQVPGCNQAINESELAWNTAATDGNSIKHSIKSFTLTRSSPTQHNSIKLLRKTCAEQASEAASSTSASLNPQSTVAARVQRT
jgi:hypothetical protein